jgi:hypothetical protein
MGIIIRSEEFSVYAGKRAEQLSVDDFVKLTLIIQKESAL